MELTQCFSRFINGKKRIFFHREPADNSETIFRVSSFGRVSRVWKVILFVVSHSNVYAWRHHHLYSDNEKKNIKHKKCQVLSHTQVDVNTSSVAQRHASELSRGRFCSMSSVIYIYAEFHTNCQNVNRERKRTMWRRKNLNIWNSQVLSPLSEWTLRWVIFIRTSQSREEMKFFDESKKCFHIQRVYSI